MKSFFMLLPIAWALVATCIGLVLYKTSDAFWEETKTKNSNAGKKRRSIRLVGSVAIAAFAFIGMWRATPAEVRTPLPPSVRVVEKQELIDIFDMATELDRMTLRLQAAVSTDDIRICKQNIEYLRRKSNDLSIKAANLLDKGGANEH